MPDLIGTTLGHYRIVEKIGEGGMGMVYRAQDERLDRDVAVKVLHEAVAQNADRLARFEKEAKAVAKLDHPNILAIHELGTHQGAPFIVTELLDGQNLRQSIPASGMPWQKVVEIGAAIADGLAAAHGKGIVHRDLKPENVFIMLDGRVKILDFGLAQVKVPVEEEAETATITPKGTVAGTVMGTMGYMSPEQLRGEPSDARSDIFALGCVLYEMLSGQTAFLRNSTAETSAAILKEEPERLSSTRMVLPAGVERSIHRCLEKSPDARYQSSADLAFALRFISTDQVISPITAAEDMPLGKRKRTAWIVGAAAIVVVAAVALWFQRSSPVVDTSEVTLPRIVVLPFENLGSTDDEYFADGITEEITSRLAAVSGLQVISRTSAMQYKERRPPLQQIGEELDVGYVLEGTIRWDRSGEGHGRVRITPQLIKVADDSHLWSERYDRVLEDIFTVQSDIAEEVVGRLNVVLLEPEKAALELQPTDNFDAYQAYLLAQHYGSRSELTEDFELAVDLFERAIDLDPNFALAYAGLTETQSRFIHYRVDISPVRRAKAAEAADKALELGPHLPEARRARGYYFYWALRDYERALTEFSLAAKGKPGDGDVWAGIAWILRRQGRMRDALTEMEKALDLDPQNAVNTWNYGYTRTFLRDYKEGAEYIERALSMAPDLIAPYYRLASTYRLWDGSPERARVALESMPGGSHPIAIYSWLVQELYERNYEEALERLRAAPVSVFELPRKLLPMSLAECECLLALGQSEDAHRACENARGFLDGVLKDQPDDPRIHSALGKTYALLGRKAEAIRHGEDAVAIWPVSKDAYDGVYFEIDLAETYVLTGEPELAIAKLEYLLSIPSLVSAADLRFNPKWDPLRDHPRFQALLEEYEVE